MIIHTNNNEACPICNEAMFSYSETPIVAECLNGHKFLRVNGFITVDNDKQLRMTENELLDCISKSLLEYMK